MSRMEFFSKVNIESPKERITFDDRLFFLGSCFASEIGGRMADNGFNSMVNPFGMLFNPASIEFALRLCTREEAIYEGEIIKREDLYFDLMHGSEFCAFSQDELLTKLNKNIKLVRDYFDQSSIVVITLGTSWVYRYLATNKVVSNCHKLPSINFNREFLDIDNIYTLLRQCVEMAPKKRWIFTVSPVRHLKDGAHGNQLSKSSLLLALDRLCKEFANCEYFPAYEIVLDELRDYRFYAEDLVHPSKAAADYIFERFSDAWIAESCHATMSDFKRLKAMKAHRPMLPEGVEYARFLSKIEELEQKLRKK